MTVLVYCLFVLFFLLSSLKGDMRVGNFFLYLLLALVLFFLATAWQRNKEKDLHFVQEK